MSNLLGIDWLLHAKFNANLLFMMVYVPLPQPVICVDVKVFSAERVIKYPFEIDAQSGVGPPALIFSPVNCHLPKNGFAFSSVDLEQLNNNKNTTETIINFFMISFKKFEMTLILKLAATM